jgi:hypothetical protein
MILGLVQYFIRLEQKITMKYKAVIAIKGNYNNNYYIGNYTLADLTTICKKYKHK